MRVQDIVNRMLDEICRANIPLKVLVLELGMEKEHNKDTGKGNPRTFKNFGLLLDCLKDRCPLFCYDEALDSQVLEKIGSLRRTVSEQLNRVHGLLTQYQCESKMPNTISEAYRVLSACCTESLPTLAAGLTGQQESQT